MNKALKTKIEEYASIKLAKNHLAQIQKLYQDQVSRKKYIGDKIDTYIEQIDKLDSTSILAIHKKIQASRTHKLELYKQHYLNLVLEYNELNESLKLLEFEIQILAEKVSRYDMVLNDMNQALKAATPDGLEKKYLAYRSSIKQLESKIILCKEIEETIIAGEILNKRLNAALNYIIKVGQTIIKEKRNVEGMLDFNIRKISTFQRSMVRIHESIVKFTNEIGDVYSHISADDTLTDALRDRFLDQYRNNLIVDLIGQDNLANSYAFLKSNKNYILSLMKTMRKDVKQLKKDITDLEEQEENLLAAL